MVTDPSFAIQIKNLSKHYVSFKKNPGIVGAIGSFFNKKFTTKIALENFNLEIKKGEIIGLLGPNGAGKTTLMKMLSGIIVPTSGEVRVFDFEPAKRQLHFKKKIALVMGQKSQLWWDIPAMDSFELLQKFYELPIEDFKKRVFELSDLLNVREQLNTQVRRLSLGERMKLELIASLLHKPDVIFLDEPTIGLDLIAQEKIRNFILDYHKRNNTTIILTSHYMADVEALCSRIVLVMDGKKGYDGSLGDFRNLLGDSKTIQFDFENSIDAKDYFENFSPEWKSNSTVQITIRATEFREVTSHILAHYPVINIITEQMPIEYVMKAIMNKTHLL